jgi:hypothetical protein
MYSEARSAAWWYMGRGIRCGGLGLVGLRQLALVLAGPPVARRVCARRGI